MSAATQPSGADDPDELGLCTILADTDLFTEVPVQDLFHLLGRMTRESAEAGAVLMEEGAPSDRMLILLEGEVVVTVAPGHEVGRIGAGRVVGDWGVLMDRPRSASVSAATPVRFLDLSADAYNAWVAEDPARALQLLRGADNVVQALHKVTDRLTRELDTSNALRSRHAEGMRLAMAAIASLAAYTLLLDVIRGVDEGLSSYTWLNVPITLGFGGLVMWLIHRSPAPRAEFGLTLRGAGRASLEGLAFALGLATVTLVLSRTPMFSAYFEPRLLVLQVLDGSGPPLGAWLQTMGLYCLVIAPVQEFVVRGVLQSSLERLGEGRWRELSANVFANLIFATTHLVYSHAIVGMVFCFGLLIGMLWTRQKSLLGVIVAHSMGGALLLWGVGLVGVE